MPRRKKSSLYRYSDWVETTFTRSGKEILMPIRARGVFRAKKARGESQILRDGVWEAHMTFPWCDLGFQAQPHQYNELGESIADAIIHHFEDNDPVGFEEVLAESPVVEAVAALPL
jgi:hypothetical protein